MEFEVGDLVKYKKGQAHYTVTKVYKCAGKVEVHHPGNDEFYETQWHQIEHVEKPKSYSEQVESILGAKSEAEEGQDTLFKWEEQVKTNVTKGLKMQKTINKLNGLKLGEEQIVELSQEIAQKESFSVSLFSLLNKNELVTKLGFGKESLLHKLELQGENLVFKLTKGEVVKEENVASIQELIKKL